MEQDEVDDYAAWLIEDYANDIEWLSLFEAYSTYKRDDSAEITGDEASRVLDRIRAAKITITWDET